MPLQNKPTSASINFKWLLRKACFIGSSYESLHPPHSLLDPVPIPPRSPFPSLLKRPGDAPNVASEKQVTFDGLSDGSQSTINISVFGSRDMDPDTKLESLSIFGSRDMDPDTNLESSSGSTLDSFGAGLAASRVIREFLNSSTELSNPVANKRVFNIQEDQVAELHSLGTLTRILDAHRRVCGRVLIDNNIVYRSMYFQAVLRRRLYELKDSEASDNIEEISETTVLINNIAVADIVHVGHQIEALGLAEDKAVFYETNGRVKSTKGYIDHVASDMDKLAMDVSSSRNLVFERAQHKAREYSKMFTEEMPGILHKYAAMNMVVRPEYQCEFERFARMYDKDEHSMYGEDLADRFLVYIVVGLYLNEYEGFSADFRATVALFVVAEINEAIKAQGGGSKSFVSTSSVYLSKETGEPCEHADTYYSMTRALDYVDALGLIDWEFAGVLGYRLANRYAAENHREIMGRAGCCDFFFSVKPFDPSQRGVSEARPVAQVSDGKLHSFVREYVRGIYVDWGEGFELMVLEEVVVELNELIKEARLEILSHGA